MAFEPIKKIVFLGMLIIAFLAAFSDTKAQESTVPHTTAIRGFLNEELSTSPSFHVSHNVGVLHSVIVFDDPNAPLPPTTNTGGGGGAPIYQPARDQAEKETENIGNEDPYAIPGNDDRIYRNSAQRDLDDPTYTSADKPKDPNTSEGNDPLVPNTDYTPEQPETPSEPEVQPNEDTEQPNKDNSTEIPTTGSSQTPAPTDPPTTSGSGGEQNNVDTEETEELGDDDSGGGSFADHYRKNPKPGVHLEFDKKEKLKKYGPLFKRVDCGKRTNLLLLLVFIWIALFFLILFALLLYYVVFLRRKVRYLEDTLEQWLGKKF